MTISEGRFLCGKWKVKINKIRCLQGYDRIKDAESHGIEFENDIRRYIEYLVIYGTRLDERKQTQWIANVLQ